MDLLTAQAREYLYRDPLRYMDMLGRPDRGMVEVVSSGRTACCCTMFRGRHVMLAADSLDSGKALCAGVDSMEIGTCPRRGDGGFCGGGTGSCRICGAAPRRLYLEREPLPVPLGVEIRPLGEEFFSVILENYHSFTDPEYIQSARRRGDARGLSKGAADGLYRHARRGQRGHAGGAAASYRRRGSPPL